MKCFKLFFVVFMLFSVYSLYSADSVESTIKRGQLIYDADFYGSKGTDFLLDKKVLQNDKRLKGWIVVIDGDKKARVIFYGKNAYDTGYAGYHQATFSGSDIIYTDISKQPLGANETALVKARELVVSQFKPACPKKYNTAVFQYENRIAVYMLASTTVQGEIPLGGSEVFYTDLKGEKIIDQKAFFSSCLTLEKKENAVAIAINQVTNDIPNEIIAFASIAYDIPFVVLTPDRLSWSVTKGKIVKQAVPNAKRGR